MKNIVKHCLIGSIIFACIFHITFNCYNPFGFVSCSTLLNYSSSVDLGLILFLVCFIGMAFFAIKATRPYMKFKGNNLIDMDLITGSDLTYEDEQLRKEFWKNGALFLIWGACWLPVIAAV